MRVCLAVLVLASMAGCGPNYSPDTYSANAVQQANKVDRGVVIGVRAVEVSVDTTLGAATGAAAGGAVGSTAGGSVTSTLGAVGGALLGGLVGAGAEKAVANTKAFEYIVRKPNGDLISVTQKDNTALPVGQKVLVIAGNQARIVPDYTTDAPVEAHKDITPTPLPPPEAPAVPASITEAPLTPVGATPPAPTPPSVSGPIQLAPAPGTPP